MKVTKKILIAICFSLVITFGIPVAFPAFTQSITVEAATKVKLSKKKATIDVGKSIQLKMKGTKSKVKWSSNKKSVAKVTSKGKVTGKKPGKAVITATVEGKKYKCTVTVKNAIINVTGITLNKSEIQLEEGDNITLTATVLPNNATNKSVSWSSSNINVATVKNGIITGISAGNTTITATAGDKQSICKVTVKKATYTEEEIIAAIWLHFLTNRLRDPSSLQVSDIVIWGDDTSPSIEIAYSAKNAYGGRNTKSLLGSLYGSDENTNKRTPYIILPNGKYTFPNRRNPKPNGIHLTEKDKRLDINRVKRITGFTYDFNFYVDEYDMFGWHEKDKLSNEILQ